jgi:predicted PurR-regulated permease PerM
MARSVLAIFCLSILFAYLIDPVVRFLDRHSLLRRKARGVHIAEAYLGVLILVAGTVYVLIPQASSRPGVFLRNVASFSDRLVSGEFATEVGQTNGWSEAQTFRAKEFLTSHRETIRKVSSQIQSLAAMILGAGAVMPILAIFFLADGRRLADMALAAFATEENPQGKQCGEQLDKKSCVAPVECWLGSHDGNFLGVSVTDSNRRVRTRTQGLAGKRGPNADQITMSPTINQVVTTKRTFHCPCR